METKLTLKLEKELITEAKNLAKLKGTNLSKMIANYLNSVVTFSKKENNTSPILFEITGILPSNLDNKHLQDDYKKHLKEKYLWNQYFVT